MGYSVQDNAIYLRAHQRLRKRKGEKNQDIEHNRNRYSARVCQLKNLTWMATGGEIDSSETFVAGAAVRRHTITARSRPVSHVATIEVYESQASEDDGAIAQPAAAKTQLTWSGEVTTQKWMNFYMKVLSKFATDQRHALTLRVSFEARNDQGVAEQKVEETRIALRELGLDDDVTTR
jgi:hypothetical protein